MPTLDRQVAPAWRCPKGAGSTVATRGEFLLISMAAEHLGMHPQTLRKYERLGLVRPTRTLNSARVYSHGEIERLRTIKYLVDELGINLAGVERLLSIAEVVQRLRPLVLTPVAKRAQQRQLAQELERLSELLGL
jgi:MerR family transcriptional regulator/heat shock protein HspR